MLNLLKDFFEQHLAPTGPAPKHDPIPVATAALLVEVMRMDGTIDQVERDAVLKAVRDKFALDPADAEAVVRLAEAEAASATDFHQFTSLINRHFGADDRARVVECMWQVAYADGTLDAHEKHLIRKIAALLHVPDSAYIAAKMRAKEASGIG